MTRKATQSTKEHKQRKAAAPVVKLPRGEKPKVPQLTVESVAAFLELPMRKAKTLCTSGAFPHYRIKGSREIRIDETEFLKWVKEGYVERVVIPDAKPTARRVQRRQKKAKLRLNTADEPVSAEPSIV